MSEASQQQAEPDAVQRAAIDRSLSHPVMMFFIKAAVWLMFSLLFGLLSSIKLHSPDFLDECSWLTYGRLRAAHIDTLVYGWGCQAAFGVLIWLMARLSHQESRNSGTMLLVCQLWNVGVVLGTVGILAGFSTGVSWMEFPAFAWPVLLFSYAAIAVWSLVQFRCRPRESRVHPAQWYALAALLWFPWVFATAHVLVHCLPVHPLMAAAANAWYKSALILLFFVPTGAAAAYYLAPKMTGRPVWSYPFGMIGFWILAFVGPWAGMQKLAGAPIPYFLPYVGAAATIAAAIPMVTVGANVLGTVLGGGGTVSQSPSLRFTSAGTVGLLMLAACDALLFLPDSTLKLSQFSLVGYGCEMLALYGFFTLMMFGAIYFIVPRLTRREWLSRSLIRSHFWFSVYGGLAIVIFSIFGGLMQGVAQEAWQQRTWSNVMATTRPYAVGTTFGWALLLFSNVFFFFHLALMWLRLGRRSSHPTLLIHAHPEVGPHGPEGDIDNVGGAVG
jgi:cytochrome c oxidase cbb3-type subunit 1